MLQTVYSHVETISKSCQVKPSLQGESVHTVFSTAIVCMGSVNVYTLSF